MNGDAATWLGPEARAKTLRLAMCAWTFAFAARSLLAGRPFGMVFALAVLTEFYR